MNEGMGKWIKDWNSMKGRMKEWKNVGIDEDKDLSGWKDEWRRLEEHQTEEGEHENRND